MSENLHTHGVIDRIVSPEGLHDVVGGILEHLKPFNSKHLLSLTAPILTADARSSAPWKAVTSTRRPDRPGLQELCSEATGVIPLAYPGRGILVALARFGRTSCVVVGQDRVTQASTPIEPRDLLAARRGM